MWNTQPEMTMEETFHRYLPDTLMKSHYDLSREYGFTPTEWRVFLRDNQLFIETELAAIAEAEARSALSRLGNASGTEVSAIKALLETSKLINDSQKQNTKVVLTFIPSKEEDLKPKKKEESYYHQTILDELPPKEYEKAMMDVNNPIKDEIVKEALQQKWTPIKDDEFEPLPSLKELQERGEME
jgi:hypothetical protein